MLALTKRHNKVEASTPIAIVATIVRLFSQFNVWTNDNLFDPWAYPMKVILETRRVHSLDINVFINTL
jgi:hypothetical protein